MEFKYLHKIPNPLMELTTSLSDLPVSPILIAITNFSSISSSFHCALDMFSSIDLRKIDKFNDKLEDIEETDFEFKWLQSISVRFCEELINCYETGGNNKVNSFLTKLFRDEKIIVLFKDWLRNQPIYNERKQIIDDCLQAHLTKCFTLSIPTLLTQCDGIIINKVIKTATYSGNEVNFVNMKKVAEDGRIYLCQNLKQHLIYVYNTKRLDILHGKNVDYYQCGEELSVNLILTLFEIINVFSEVR